MKKRFISAILVIAILASQFYWLSIVMPTKVTADEFPSVASTNDADKYFYKQLDDDAKVFYGIFDETFYNCDYDKLIKALGEEDNKFGVDSRDITEKINESSSLTAKLQAYTKGNQSLLNTMGAAKDAYFADHAGLFFVDSDYVTLRVLSQNGQLKVFLGNGRSKTYINKAFWDYENKQVKKAELVQALTDVKTTLDEAVKEVKAGYECGLTIDNYNDIKENDIFEAYEEVEIKR